MRLATLIIALCLAGLVGLQSCTIIVGSNLAENKALSEGGAVGVLVAFLFVLGAAFVMALPRVAAGLFAAAAVFANIAASSSGFEDLRIWGMVAGALAVMAWLGSRELRNRAAGPQITSLPLSDPVPTPQAMRHQERSTAVPAQRNVITELERLTKLRDTGGLSADEFEGLKARLLSGQA